MIPKSGYRFSEKIMLKEHAKAKNHFALAFALVAQLDRASDFESEGREFESLRARQKAMKFQQDIGGRLLALI
jgi:hypothetical protein